jgi:hypothetical protein
MTLKFIRDVNTVLAKWFPVNYEAYISSATWRKKANAAKARALWQCQGCGRPQGVVHLEAHHRTYVRLGFEIPEDITILCRETCHPAITAVKRRVYGITRKPALV